MHIKSKKFQKKLIRYFIFLMGYLFFFSLGVRVSYCRIMLIINNRCHPFHYIRSIHTSSSLRGIASKILINVYLLPKTAWLFPLMEPWKLRHVSITLQKPTYVLPLQLCGWLSVIFSSCMPPEKVLIEPHNSTFKVQLLFLQREHCAWVFSKYLNVSLYPERFLFSIWIRISLVPKKTVTDFIACPFSTVT